MKEQLDEEKRAANVERTERYVAKLEGGEKAVNVETMAEDAGKLDERLLCYPVSGNGEGNFQIVALG